MGCLGATMLEEVTVGSTTDHSWPDSTMPEPAPHRMLMRPAIRRSWRRSSLSGVDRGRGLIQPNLDFNPETELYIAAAPVLDKLEDELGVPALIVLSDAAGRLLRFWAPDSSVRHRFENIGAYPGAGAGEDQVGTNAIGTALEEGQPMVVVGSEHYQRNFEQIACAAGIVRHPLTKRTIGSIALAALDVGAENNMLQFVVHASRTVEQGLLEQASRADRLVLEALKARAGGAHRSVVGVSRDMMMANEPGMRLLPCLDQALLWEWARETVETGRERTLEVVVGTECEPVPVQVIPVGHDVAAGALIDFGCAAANHGRRRLAVTAKIAEPKLSNPETDADPLVGHSREARHLAQHIESAAKSMRAALVTGEPGAGKAAAARSLLIQRFPRSEPVMVNCSDPRAVEQLAVCADPSGPVLITHVELLDTTVAYRLRDALRRLPELQHCCVFTMNTPPNRSGAGEVRDLPLVDELGGLTVEVPGLRYRRDDIPPLVGHFGKQNGASVRRFSLAAMQLMLRYLWPGNIRELKSVVEGAIASASGDVELADLPSNLRRLVTRRPLTPLEQAEADAILAAMRACGNNKVQAAAMLQISRSRLYRKASAYGLVGAVLS